MKKCQGSGDMGREEEFIFKIQPYITSWQKCFNFGVVSAIIAQACHETGFGMSDKAQYNNYFGLKYKEGRVTCNSGKITSTSFEYKDGVRYPIVCDWYTFADMDTGVQGYFQFINTGGYKVAKAQTTPEGYLQALKDAGYATGPNYVEHCMAIVNKYNLTQFDEGGSMGYSNSPLIDYVDLSPIEHHGYGPRTHAIDRITIHHAAMKCTVEDLGRVFHRKNATSNYGIGNDGRVGMYCEEKNAAGTSSNRVNDERAITIEVSNELCAPYWTISAAAMNTLINLCTDICQRNGIKKLIWSNSKNERVNQLNGANMSMHCDFAATTCPGPFLKQCMPNIAELVNQRLDTPAPIPTVGYFINGYDYSPVFNPEYYANKYPDLEGAFGHDANQLWIHFQTFGMNEFRQASEEFNPTVYKERYNDLESAFGEDNPMYYFHYVACGKAEGRTAN